WLFLGFATSVVVASFAACKTGTTSTGQTATNEGGAATSLSTTATSSTTGGGGTAPILCMAPYTNVPDGGACDLLQQDCPSGQTCEAQQEADLTWTTICKTSY